MPPTETASNPDPGGQHYAGYLFRAFRAESPFEAPARHRLREGDEVTIGRGETLGTKRGDSPPRLAIEVPDSWMSSSHVRLYCEDRRWRVKDLGSKNGTFLNGVRVEETVIGDGDWLEAGHTFFVFRRAPAMLGAADVTASELAAPHPSLRTMSPWLAPEFAKLAAVATGTTPVLVLGETGTGKELVARAIHALSKRSGELVAVNCAAIPDSLLESELFGHKKGAFSGATEDRPGLVRAADKGTLFLDEIAELPARAQAALLRTLQEREVRAVGATNVVPVDVRVVSATHRDLDTAVADEEFREDLLARIDGMRIAVPPLRARREDLGLIVQTLLERHAGGRKATIKLSHRAGRALFSRAWNRNVRELERALEAGLHLASDGVVDLEESTGKTESPSAAAAAAAARPERPETKERREKLRALLEQHAGNVTAVARDMGKAREQVYRWIKAAGLDPESFRKG